MDISEVVKRSGVPASTLRFYEEKGLIASIGRQGLKRRFAPYVLDQLALIALGRLAGFSLNEIAAMFTSDGQLNISRQTLIDKANEIDQMVKRLQAMSEGLKHAAVCPATTHMECLTFQGLLKDASSGLLSKRGKTIGLVKQGK
ncbi:helix-turn-helix domain-containing protein [Alkanindiges illinoisensis]|uniref:MerR family transcriptional regulator n=1 Tax=Alkanindiges illinoisensis TaxID=197183 RepID=A0A4Y7XE68_9GAMM|nr:helix-turn-helix domain-containing protein [Alkanindiges illinoisensis]TEU30055.1 MerR family transcriptional regulator [Alkanindiges illinoisensis]